MLHQGVPKLRGFPLGVASAVHETAKYGACMEEARCILKVLLPVFHLFHRQLEPLLAADALLLTASASDIPPSAPE